MRTIVCTCTFMFSIWLTYGQNYSEMIIGKWVVTDLKHYDASGNIDSDASDHFGSMVTGRTLDFHDDGTVEIPMYSGCIWHIQDDTLYVRYGKDGLWAKEKIISFEHDRLITSEDVDFPEEGNRQEMTYLRREN